MLRDGELKLVDAISGKTLGRIEGMLGRVVRCGPGWLVADRGIPGPRVLDAELRDRGRLVIDVAAPYRSAVACRGDRAAVVGRDAVSVFSIVDRRQIARLPAGDGDRDGLHAVALGGRYIAATTGTSVWLG